MNYTHFTQEERYRIHTLLREGFSTRHIALRLASAPSKIFREIKPNRNRNGYFAKHAHKLAKRRQISNHRTVSSTTWQQIESYLALQWSPEQIASHVAISMHSIYRYIEQDKLKGGGLYVHLSFRNQRKRKYGFLETSGQLSNRNSIHNRPGEIEQRTRFGDLEIDTIVRKNNKQSLFSIVDRKTGYLWLKKCSSRKSEEVFQATISLFDPIRVQLKTITADKW